MQLRILLGIALLASIGCGDSSPTQKLASTQPNNQSNTQVDSIPFDEILDKDSSFQQIRGEIYDDVPYYFVVDRDTFHVVVNGRGEEFPCNNCLIGVLNQAKEVVIPILFDKIYNPGATVDGHIEVEKSGKLGLYNLDGTEILPPKYDGIYPVSIPGALVQVQLGNTFGWVSDQGQLYMEKSHRPMLHVSPITSQQIKNWRYDLSAPGLVHFYSSDLLNDPQEKPTGIVLPPSYLNRIMDGPERIERISLEESDMADMRVHESASSVLSFRKITREIWALFSLYKEAGIDARDYQVESTHLVTLNEDLSMIDQTLFLNNGYNPSLCQESSYQLISDTLLEVKRGHYSYDPDLPYPHIETYHYYRIGADGEIDSLSSTRIFDFTKFVKITPEYFQGCFAKVTANAADEGNYVRTQHLSIEDLDLMRNEIFAEYGYIFKTEKWSTYFGEKTWYKGKHENVDRFLSSIDKYNIKIILATKEAMKGKEEAYVKPEMMMWAMPG